MCHNYPNQGWGAIGIDASHPPSPPFLGLVSGAQCQQVDELLRQLKLGCSKLLG